MAQTPHTPELPDVPEAAVAPKSTRTLQIVWLIPIVAVLVGGWLAIKAILDKGPEISITFVTAEGLEAGKTKIKYKDVEVGLVSSIAFSPDLKGVVVKVEMAKQAAPYLVEGTRFWVVRPRISGGTVTGLGTLLSGSYIGVDVSKSGKARHEYVGLEVPPVISTETPGREFVLKARNIGSLDVGSPIYFRRLQAGQVSGYELDKDGKGVTMRVFVNSPYDKFVTDNTRFWQASGIDMTLDANGVKIDTQSVVAILIGGLAFETPVGAAELPPAEANVKFDLFANRAAALKNPDTDIIKSVMIFDESVRGLTPGAPVDFRGIEIGAVTAIRVELEPASRHVVILVEAELYPLRMRAKSTMNAGQPNLSAAQRRDFIGGMVEKGMRAQLRVGNLLTGQMFIALDFFPGAPKAKLGSYDGAMELPTIKGSLAELQATIASIATKVKNFPLEEIGTDFRKTLQTADKTMDTDLKQTLQAATRMMQRIDAELTPEARDALVDARKAIAQVDNVLKPESPLSQDTREAMREIARAAAAFRVIADYLERHPEALVTGKKLDGSGNKDDSSDKKEGTK